ncbi:MAG: protoporphyrinogen/coproporphyrinogen oxidase [Bryobacteraceae bacterium]|jgi:protoporphyrinogen oxidase
MIAVGWNLGPVVRTCRTRAFGQEPAKPWYTQFFHEAGAAGNVFPLLSYPMVTRPALEQATIAIIGAGPTGLGAAHRLHELGFSNFTVFEREHQAGGLASSFVDANGFTWDIGGHVQFSHYPYFDALMDKLLRNEWLHHERAAWIWMRNSFIPYPFQNNIRHLPTEEMKDCLRGLIACVTNPSVSPSTNFEEFIRRSFGEGIARHFMLPYNFKAWAYAPSQLSYQWIGERVARVDLERVIFNIVEKRDDIGWGPNKLFRFPMYGGTGEIWRRLARCIPSGRLAYGKSLVHLNTETKQLTFSDGSKQGYDILISTMPMDLLVQQSDVDRLKPVVARLRRSSTNVIGIGLKGSPGPHLAKKCWMYFPEPATPFYRATVFSNYSPKNVPDSTRFWSLLLEVSESPVKPVAQDRIIEQAVAGLLSARLIDSETDIVSVWHYRADHGYPTPSITRDEVLSVVLPELERREVYSRGRFGAWKYEVSNQDHSLMQGVELVNRLAAGREEVTLHNPALVNAAAAGS